MGVNILSMAASIRRVESRENSPGETNVASDIQLCKTHCILDVTNEKASWWIQKPSCQWKPTARQTNMAKSIDHHVTLWLYTVLLHTQRTEKNCTYLSQRGECGNHIVTRASPWSYSFFLSTPEPLLSASYLVNL